MRKSERPHRLSSLFRTLKGINHKIQESYTKSLQQSKREPQGAEHPNMGVSTSLTGRRGLSPREQTGSWGPEGRGIRKERSLPSSANPRYLTLELLQTALSHLELCGKAVIPQVIPMARNMLSLFC